MTQLTMDLTDPENWKLAAALIGYWKEIAGGVVVIVGAVVSFLRYGLAPFHFLWSKIKSGERRKKVALNFVADDRQSRWSVAKLGDKPGTHVFGHFYVTNSSAGNVVILKARLQKYAAEDAHVHTRHREQNVFGLYPILSHSMSEVIADFTFFPPIARGRETLTSDVIFTDNFGDEHRVRSVRFPYIGPDKPL